MKQSVGKTPSIRFVYLLNMMPIIGLLVYYYTRYLEGTFSFIIPLGLTFAWIVLSLMTGRIKRLLFNKVCFWWMAYLFLCVMMVVIDLSSTNLNFIISRLPIYMIPAIGYFVVRHYNLKEKKIILTAFVVIYLANLTYNIYLGFLFPGIFDEQASTEESIEFCVLMNIANTFFIEICYMIIGILIIVALNIKDKGWKLLCILLITPIFYYMLFQNTRGIAILLLIIELVGLFLAFFEPTRSEIRRPYYLFSIGILVMLVFILFIPLMGWILEFIQSERLAERLNDLVDFSQSGGDVNNVREGSFTERILLAQTSLNSFLSSPVSVFIGIGDHSQAFGGDLVKSGIGHHSEFIDVLARYGIVGAFVFFNIMKKYYLMLKKLSFERKILKYVNVLFGIIIMSGVLNLLFEPNILLFMYIIMPVIIELVASKLNYTLSSNFKE